MIPRDVGAVVPAAGRGLRLGSRQSKALVPLAGKPLILHTLKALQDASPIGWIVVVVRPEERARVRGLVRDHRLTKISALVTGATSRALSVARGIAALPPEVRWVVIHDGARPCISRNLVESVILQAKRYGAVACGLPASVTVKAVDQGQQIRLTLDREGLWFVQTPQAFRRDWLSEAFTRANHLPRTNYSDIESSSDVRVVGSNIPLSDRGTNKLVRGQLDQLPDDPTTCLSAEGGSTAVRGRSALRPEDRWWDDAALLEWAGFPVRMVPGDPLNIKVTTKEDLVLAEAILRSRKVKDTG